jgi:hypothetical protein
MAINERLCWSVLEMLKGVTTLHSWLKGEKSDEPDILHAMPLFEIERQLVLRHTKAQIEDSLYFLQKRGYLIQHGYTGLTRVVMQLSDSALTALENGKFSDEEQQAFKEALFDVKQPGWMGMKVNLAEVIRRARKTRRK